ncbi:MAG: hypothetical protein NTX03_05575 [Bacteroidetes bacterium]|nr:hypothetical protein [Bacteroidota bacterium]
MLNYSNGSMQLPIDWRIKREPIYRLLDDVKYLDDFFNKGEIKVSCFENFKKYPDEIRGDTEEGGAGLIWDDKDSNTHFLKYEAGLNAFILSTTNEINDKIIEAFDAKCAIKINHPNFFALELAKKIPFVTAGLEGNCDYSSSRLHFFEKEIQTDKHFQKLDFQNNQNSQVILQQLTQGMELFLKLDKYSYQKEYRLVWFSSKKINDAFVVTCPEAIAYCDKIIF